MTLLPRRIKIRGDTFFRRFNATLNVLTQLVTAGEPEAQRDPRVRLKDATRVSQAETRERVWCHLRSHGRPLPRWSARTSPFGLEPHNTDPRTR